MEKEGFILHRRQSSLVLKALFKLTQNGRREGAGSKKTDDDNDIKGGVEKSLVLLYKTSIKDHYF